MERFNFLDVGGCFLILIAPFLHYLEFIDYPFLTSEGFMILIGFLLFSFLLFAFIPTQSYLLRCLLFTNIIMITFDFSTLPFVPAAASTIATPLLLFMVFLFLWFLRKNMSVLLLVMFFTVNLSTLILMLIEDTASFEGDENTIASADNEALPNVLHLYLDGLIGIEGIPQDLHDGKALAQDFKNFFRINDFQTFGGAHSSYYRSIYSITGMLNFNNSPKKLRENIEIIEKNYAITYKLKRNAYFKKLHEQGYNINVYQAEFMDFCDPLYVQAKDCFMYMQNAPDRKAMGHLGFGERLKLLWYTFAREQAIVEKLIYYQLHLSSTFTMLPQNSPLLKMLVSVGAMSISSVIDKIAQDVTSSKGGNVYFAHVLIPHSPYIWNAQCHLKKSSETWASPFLELKNWVIPSAKRVDLYREYFKQVRCVKLKLQNLFTHMKKSGNFENTIIVIHSDHGSRIAENTSVYVENHAVSSRDMQDGFSTLFAIKIPGEPASYDHGMKSLNKIFFKYMGKGVEQTDTHEGAVFFEIPELDADELSEDYWQRMPIH